MVVVNFKTFYKKAFSGNRLHHEIYLTDARKATPEKWKTMIRHSTFFVQISLTIIESCISEE